MRRRANDAIASYKAALAMKGDDFYHRGDVLNRLAKLGRQRDQTR